MTGVDLSPRPGAAPAPRNRALHEQGRALRAEIREMLQCHPPLAPPLTAKRIRELLTNNTGGIRTPSLRTIQWHVAAIRAAAVNVVRGERI